MDGITAFWMVGLNKVVCDCVLWRSGSHCWYAGNWKSCNVCRIFSVKAIFETRESRPKFISSTREQNFQKCPALFVIHVFIRWLLILSKFPISSSSSPRHLIKYLQHRWMEPSTWHQRLMVPDLQWIILKTRLECWNFNRFGVLGQLVNFDIIRITWV